MSLFKNPFQLLCRRDNYVLYALIEENVLSLRVTLAVSNTQSRQFDIKIASFENYSRIAEYCESFNNLIQLLKDNGNNILFDSNKQILTIFQKNRFGRLIQLASLQLKQTKSIKIEANQIIINNLLPKINSQTDLTPQQIKQMFGSLSECFLWMHGQIKNKSSCNQNKSLIIDSNKIYDEIQCLRKQLNDYFIQIKQINTIQEITQYNQKQIKEDVTKLRQQIKQIKINLKQINNKGLKQNIESLNNKQASLKINRIQQKITQLSEDMQRKLQKIFNRLDISDNCLKFYDKVWPTKALDFIDHRCANYKDLQIRRNKITNLNNNTDESVHIYSKIPITQHTNYFVFKFEQVNNLVCAGIVDIQYMKEGLQDYRQFIFVSFQWQV